MQTVGGARWVTLWLSNGRRPDDTYGREAWVTDGTTSGTQLLKDIRSGSSSSSPYEFVVSGDKALFQAYDGVVGQEVWVTDGTSDGTQLLIDANSGSSNGNPIACAAALATIEVLTEPGFLDNVQARGDQLIDALRDLLRR